eukprot:1141012-Pelagomonas_calceolata.AAC.6
MHASGAASLMLDERLGTYGMRPCLYNQRTLAQQYTQPDLHSTGLQNAQPHLCGKVWQAQRCCTQCVMQDAGKKMHDAQPRCMMRSGVPAMLHTTHDA